MADQLSPLESEIRRRIAVGGPISVADYMQLCLTHPQHGYYISRDPFGARGDFITAPEINQMFGELIGLWAATVWRQMGEPQSLRLIELGPGRGTLLIDALRAAKVAGRFSDAIKLHLVEIGPALQRLQKERLESLDVPKSWHATLEDVPDGRCIIIANEFIDALPVHQAVKRSSGWYERVIEIDSDGNLVFGLNYDPLPHFEATLPQGLRNCPNGSIFEWRPDSIALELGRRVRSDGAALIVDYGHVQCALGDTLQAVAGHAYANPLRAPGDADLTAHVDFDALAQRADILGCRIHGPISQRDFLLRLGIDQRAAVLKASAARDKAHEIDQALARLTATGAKGMGELFKVLAIADPKLGGLPGFETSS
jgi:SAM-dependent MidA family methyltransferase